MATLSPTNKPPSKETNKHVPVRLRPSEVRQRVLNAAYDGVLREGFRAVTIESVSAETGIAKTSIYRRWPNKASMVMDAFALRISLKIAFQHSKDPTKGIRLQMLALAMAFRGPAGTVIKTLLGEAQFDPELADAFRRHWLLPRRQAATEAIQAAIDSGMLRPDIDIQQVLDAPYGGLYYRLLTGLGPLSNSYMEGIFKHVMKGVRGEPSKTPFDGGKKTRGEGRP
jgi:AcrR family transcriptional regulator